MMPHQNIKVSDDDLTGVKFDVEEYAIGGKLINVSFFVSELTYALKNSDEEWRQEMREKLVRALIDHILENKMVEIMVKPDLLNQANIISAYMYLAPNEQVKILRTLKLKNGK